MEKEKYPPNKKESVKGLFACIKGLTIIAAIILALWSFSGTSCIFRSIIGLPCPACGMTRATIGLMKGNVSWAFKMNPAVFLVPIVFLFLFLEKALNINISFKWWMACCIIIAVIYVVRMILFFPQAEPMIINYNSLLFRILRIAGVNI